ncbi:MAG TPA: carbon-nitrogen hydrolase family protein [Candidatus Borkfalkia excrementigallinarum]|uniref:Carbon-nitrogen hydrolase family protein n=1 Tax=Candidatus Borkfalkia excrementigallinarum TaxID=2838506 RepID=A0A9D1ZXA5_9FIRM|nr:carbon-nitrogen hydrolase family protein [Candidatus Borkfalkia excrementigallinarum]
MKIRFVTEGSLNEYWEGAKRADCDLLVFGFDGLGEVDYRRELAGETSKLEDMAILSREAGCTVISGCFTDSCGVRHKSAAIAEKGRILGVADMLHVTEPNEFKSGAHLKVYETAAGKIGLCVGEDLYFPSVCESLALFDADVIVSVFGAAEDFVPQLMMRACAFSSGVNVCMCAAGIAQIASPDGDIRMRAARRECDFEFVPAREYRLTTVRTRALSQKKREDY